MSLFINFKVNEIAKRWNVLRAQLMLTCKRTLELNSNLINTPFESGKKTLDIFFSNQK